MQTTAMTSRESVFQEFSSVFSWDLTTHKSQLLIGLEEAGLNAEDVSAGPVKKKEMKRK